MKKTKIISVIAKKNILIITILIIMLSVFEFAIVYSSTDKKIEQQTEIINESIARDVEYKLLNLSRLSTQVFFNNEFQEASLHLNEIDNFYSYEIIYKHFANIILFDSLVLDIAYFPLTEDDNIVFEQGIYQQNSLYLLKNNFASFENLLKNDDSRKGTLFYNKLYSEDGIPLRYVALSRVVLKSYGENIYQPIGLGILIINSDQLFETVNLTKVAGVSTGIISPDMNIIYQGNLSSFVNFEKIDIKNLRTKLQIIGYFDWYIISVFTRAAVLKNIKTIYISYAFTNLLIIIITSIIFFLISYSNSKEYYRFITTFNHIGKGNFNTKMEYTQDKDINKVIQYFNNMMDSINKLNKDILRSKMKSLELIIENKSYLIKYLNSEINKHFLFNTFSLIRALVNLGEKEKVVDCIDSLCDVLRYSLVPGDTATIKQELRALKSYINIQNHRRPNINVSLKYDSRLNNIKIPKFILQPLIENSYKHSFSDNRGNIYLDIIQNEEKIIFTVSDDGVGASQEKIEEINNALINNHEQISNVDSGIALINIQRRIKAIASEKSNILVSSNNGKGFVTKMIIISEKIDV
ncbi:MAG TPA: histidine kinase [Acholeplasmataceae bacterium]|nr:histidine kinase [Acholeplasmataceae bacterium]